MSTVRRIPQNIPWSASRESVDGGHVDGWERLAATSGVLPTQDVAWAIASLDAFDAEPRMLVLGDPAAPDAIAPLVLDGRQLELASVRLMREPADLLASSADALGELAEGIVRGGTPVLLRRTPAGSPSIAALRRAVGARGVVRLTPAPGHPVIELGEAWTEPGGGLSSSRRSSLRRARRRAEKSGEVRIDLLTPTPDEIDALLDEAFAIEDRSWKGRAGTSLSQSPELARFVRRYAHETAARGTLRLQFLAIGDERVAMQLAVEWRRRLWLLKIGFDESRSDGSPGQLLLAESVADAARRGLEGYELLGEAADWTRAWTEQERECVSLAVYPASRQGFVGLSRVARESMRSRSHARLLATVRAAERVAAHRYVAGPELADALRQERRYALAGYDTTVGYWNGGEGTPKEVAGETAAAAEALPRGGQLSIKQPSMGGGEAGLDALLERCRERDLSLHLDALAPETAEAVLRAAVRLAPQAPGEIGCTLPGRWRRSVADALVAVEHGLRVRIVKSEWADPDDPERDPVDGFLAVVDALAGSADHVAVATHDAPLAAESLDRLVSQGTPCELQVLHGMNGRAAIREARRRDVPVRVYIPYGNGRVPYSVFDRGPRTLVRLAYDVLPLASVVPVGGIPL